MSAPAPIVERLLAIAAEQPDAVAVSSGARALTYGALVARALSFAGQLARRGIGPTTPVAVVLPRSPEWVVAVLALWMRGAVPVPIDPALPLARQRDYVKRSGAQLAIGVPRRPSPAAASLTVDLDARPTPVPMEPVPMAPVAEEALSWLIFTSGTTGEPKGVEVMHRGLLPLLEAQIAAFGLTRQSRCLWILSPGFDASFSDVGTALVAGATLSIAPELDPSDPEQLFRTIRRERITHIDLPPALLPYLDPDLCPPSLAVVVIGGEVAEPSAVRRWAERVRLINVYGPTEATVCASLVECDAAWDRPLLGDPIASARYAIEDGELLIGGPGVARGYLDAPALTRARFVFRDGQRWFRTGDLVRRDPDGALVFAGRRDRQRKVRGQLVAPEEIEGCIASHPSVVRAVVDLDHGPVAYLETRDAVCEATLRDHVAASLPSYMIPVRFVFQSRLPTTAAGKVDVGALDPTLTALLSVVGRVLAMPPPDSSARFADLGGTSLSALEVVAAMEALGVPISADALLCSSSLSALTLDGAAARDETPTVAALERDALALLDLPTIRACAQGAAVETYLVTGATGSLGARIAQGLLQETRATIVCLVRGERTRALERTLDALSAHGPVDRERLVVHNGDLTSPLLGIDEARHASLAASVDHVVHAAARVSVTAPLAALYPANVEGTGRILELAMTGRPKRFTYASTLSVFVGTEDREGTFLETRWPNPDARVFGGYAQSKVAAESLVRRAAAHLSATQIIRYGLLTGDTETGRAAPGAWLDRTIRGLSRLGVVPEDADPDLAFDVTPVDWAAAATVRLVTRDRGPLSVFHVAGERAVSFRVLRRALDREGVSLEDVPRDHFVARVNALLAESNDSDVGAACLALSRLLGPASARRHRGLDLFEATRTRFDASRTLTVLAGETPRPLPTDALLRRYVESALEART